MVQPAQWIIHPALDLSHTTVRGETCPSKSNIRKQLWKTKGQSIKCRQNVSATRVYHNTNIIYHNTHSMYHNTHFAEVLTIFLIFQFLRGQTDRHTDVGKNTTFASRSTDGQRVKRRAFYRARELNSGENSQQSAKSVASQTDIYTAARSVSMPYQKAK